MIALKFICFCFYLTIVVGAERKIPSYVQICKRNDPDLSKCWKDSVMALKPYLIKGIPEFDVPPLNAFHVEKAHIGRANSKSMNLVADLIDFTIYGLEDYNILNSKLDAGKGTLEMDMAFPKLTLKGKYKAKGKILAFDFEGEGKTELEIVKPKGHGAWTMKVVNKNGKDHFKIDKSEGHLELETASVYLHDLFKGNPEITDSVNKAINENVDVLYEEIRPLAAELVLSVLNQYIQRVLDLYSVDVLFPAG